jgi:ATP-dependent Clp protease protease subunit
VSKKTAKTEFDEILSNGVDFKNRRIYFGLDEEDETPAGSFTWESVEVVIRALHKMESDYASKPIELHMSSYGGETDEMLRLYDAIQICTCQIKFYGSGKIMSAASWIMAGCDERYLTPNTQIMIHKWRGDGEGGTETDQKIEIAHYGGWLTDKLNQIYADNSRMPVAFWEEVTKRDLHLTPEETIQLGLADFIVPYAKRGNLRRKRMALLKKKDNAGMKRLVNDINKRIHRGKNLKIELHTPEEEFDKTVIIDDSVSDVVDVSEPLMKETVLDPTDQLEPVCDSTDDGSE